MALAPFYYQTMAALMLPVPQSWNNGRTTTIMNTTELQSTQKSILTMKDVVTQGKIHIMNAKYEATI